MSNSELNIKLPLITELSREEKLLLREILTEYLNQLNDSIAGECADETQ